MIRAQQPRAGQPVGGSTGAAHAGVRATPADTKLSWVAGLAGLAGCEQMAAGPVLEIQKRRHATSGVKTPALCTVVVAYPACF